MGYLVGVGAHMGAEHEIRQVLKMLAAYPARTLRLPGYGLRAGCRTNLVIWETERTEEIVGALSPCSLIVKAGRVTLEHTRLVAETWRQTS